MCFRDSNTRSESRGPAPRRRRRQSQHTTATTHAPQETPAGVGLVAVSHPPRTTSGRLPQLPDAISRMPAARPPALESPLRPPQRRREASAGPSRTAAHDAATSRFSSSESDQRSPARGGPSTRPGPFYVAPASRFSSSSESEQRRPKAADPYQSRFSTSSSARNSQPSQGNDTGPRRGRQPLRGPSSTLEPQVIRPSGRSRSRGEGSTPATWKGEEKALSPARPFVTPESSIGIGIETEFLLQSLEAETRRNDIADFAKVMAELHNQEIPEQYPRMYSEFMGRRDFDTEKYSEWTLLEEITVETSQEPWGLEMNSPILRAYEGSQWREHVRATWGFLRDRFRVLKNKNCSTHVHISVLQGFTLRDIKKIAQCIIHFEPAMEVLVPPERRGNEYSKSNWIDNLNFADKNVSRSGAIDRIEAATRRDEVISLMTPGVDRYFAWNFLSMKNCNTIEHRKGAASTSVDDVLAWAELAMTFVQCAMQSNVTPGWLSKIPSNVESLQQFLLQEKEIPGMSDPRYLSPLFAGTGPKQTIQPRIVRTLSPEEKAMLRRKRDSDNRRNSMLIKIQQAPWI